MIKTLHPIENIIVFLKYNILCSLAKIHCAPKYQYCQELTTPEQVKIYVQSTLGPANKMYILLCSATGNSII